LTTLKPKFCHGEERRWSKSTPRDDRLLTV